MGYLEARVTRYGTADKTSYDEVLNGWLNLQYTDEVNGPGSGQVTIPVLDPKVQANLALLDTRNIVTLLRGGAVEGRFIVQSRELVMANGAQTGDMADRVWVISGEGLRTLTHDAVVFPENGSVNSTTPSNRVFNFGTVTKSRWYDSSQWNTPNVGPKYLAKGSNFGKWPTSWPITNGNWIWGSSGITSSSGNSATGTCYFRGEFSVSTSGTYSFYAAADDSMDIFVDGALVSSTKAGASSWDTTTSVTGIQLDPGNHVFAAKVYNKKGRGGFIGCVRRDADVGATVTVTTTLASGKKKTTTKAASATTVIVTGDSHWKVCAYPSQEPGWTPGEVMLQLWSEAKARGVDFPNYMTPTFTADNDSYGNPWPSTTTYSFTTNQEYFDVITTIEGLIADIYFDPRDYSFNMYAQQGIDWTDLNTYPNPPTLRLGQNVTTADETSVGAVKNGLLVQTADGWTYKTDTNSLAKYGRIEGGASVSSNTDQSSALISQTFKLLSTPNVSTTYEIHDDSVFLPGSDFRCGDWVLAPNMLSPSDAALTKRRVMSITYSADTTNNLPTAVYAIELDTIYQDRITLLNRLIQRLTNSSSVTASATSTASGGSTGAGDAGPTAGGTGNSSSSLSIDPPGNFAVETNIGAFDASGAAVAQLLLDWTPPIDDDGSSQDVAYYEVYGSSSTQVWGLLERTELNQLTIDLPPGQSWTLGARAIAAWDSAIVSDFSTTVTITTASPLTPLDPPTAPVVTSKLGVATVSWDGNLLSPAGAIETPPAQLVAVQAKVYAKGSPGTAQLMGQTMNVAGSSTISGLLVGSTYEFELVAFDTAGLVSAPSDTVEATVIGVDLGSLDADLQKLVSDQASASSVFSATTPGSDWERDGVLWFNTSDGNAISRWDAASSTWIPVPYGEGALGPNSITAREIAAGSIDAGALTAGSVLADAIEAGAVTTEKLSAGAVTTDKVAANAIEANNIAAGAITSEMLTVGAVPVPSTDRVANQPTDYNWWHDYALPLEAPGAAGIYNWTLGNENSRVSAATSGLVFDTTSGTRALIGLTAMYPVPDSGAITISWAGSGLLPVRVRENDPQAANGITWGSYGNIQHALYKFSPTTTSYGVYVEVPANSGVSVLVAIHVFEVIGTAGGNGQQGVQISPAGIQLTNVDGSTRITLGTDNSDVLQIVGDDGSGNPIAEATIDSTGVVTGQQVNAVQDMAIQGSNLVGGLPSNLPDSLANGNPWPVGGPGDTTDMGMLDIGGRSVTYQARWSSANGLSNSGKQFYFISSDSFQVEDGRMVMLYLNNGGLSMNNTTNVNAYARLQISLTQFNETPVPGTSISSEVVYHGNAGAFPSVPTVWTTLAMATPAIDYTNFILPAGVPIFWQYYIDMSSVPTSSYTLDEYGQTRSMQVIDLGSNAIVGGTPIDATDLRAASASGGSGSSSSGTTTTTKTWNCSFSGSFRLSGSTPVSGGGIYADPNMLYQGFGASPMGAIFGFPALGISSKTVKTVQLYLRNRHTYTGGSVTVHMKTMSNTSTPGSISGEGSQTFSWGAGQGKWVTLPSSWFSGIGSGATRSFQIGVESSQSQYAYFDGYTKSDPPKLRVTYH